MGFNFKPQSDPTHANASAVHKLRFRKGSDPNRLSFLKTLQEAHYESDTLSKKLCSVNCTHRHQIYLYCCMMYHLPKFHHSGLYDTVFLLSLFEHQIRVMRQMF